MQTSNFAPAKENLVSNKPTGVARAPRQALGERTQNNGTAFTMDIDNRGAQVQPAGTQVTQQLQQQPAVRQIVFDVGAQALAEPASGITGETLDPAIEDIDAYDQEDPQFCTEYANEIFHFMREKEMTDPITNYMLQQYEITSKHRMILVDWMAEVTVKFRLLVETLFLAVNILDRFLQRKAVARPKLQLVGVTAMLVASKYEEILTPEVNDFVWITAKAYTREEVLKMERLILSTLDFELSIPTPLHFLRRYSKAARSDSRIHTLSKYITEVSMVDYGMTAHPPSMIAAASVYIARQMTVVPAGDVPWSKTLEHYTAISEAALLPCARDLNKFLAQQATSRYQATFRKYAQDKLLAVARIPTKVF